jgi:hypothetical protein
MAMDILRFAVFLSASLTIVAVPTISMSEGVLEPEACILDTLKSTPSKDSNMMIRWNCIRRYIKAVEKVALGVDPKYFTHATAQWTPAQQGYPNNPELFVVTLKNDSDGRVVAADVAILNKKTSQQEVYKAYVDYPIDPGTVGKLEFQSITEPAPDFWKQYTWGLVKVYIVSVP